MPETGSGPHAAPGPGAERAPRPRSRRRHLLDALAATAVLVHLVGLYQAQGPPAPSWFLGADKVEHLLGFAAPVCLILLAGRERRAPEEALSSRFVLLVVVVFSLHAVVSEAVQHFFYPDRVGDLLDVLADGAGVALGSAVALLLGARAGRAAAAGPPRNPSRVR